MFARALDANSFLALTERVNTDAELVSRFAADRDEAAFAELVRRHGPLVYRECLRTAGPDAADDAFQATFLVLVRRAGQLERPDRVAGWLFGVASRIARRARRQHARRRARETPVGVLPDVPTTAAGPADWRVVVHEELARLPADYRAAVVLCDLEGHPRREAARLLGVPDGTLSNRLTRARALLGRRLLRRGVGLGGLTGLALAGVPPQLLAATVDLARSGPTTARVNVLAADRATRTTLTRAAILAVAGVVALVVSSTRPEPIAATPADPPPDPKPVDGLQVRDLAVSPDGKLLAAMEWTYKDRSAPAAISFFDPTTFKRIRRVTAPDHVVGPVQFAPGGKTAFVNAAHLNGPDEATVNRVDVDTWKVTARLDPAAGFPFEFAVSPDGKTLAVILQPVRPVIVEGELRKGIRVGLYDAVTLAHIRDMKADVEFGLKLAFAPDGNALGVVYHGRDAGKRVAGIVEFDPASGKELRRCKYEAAPREPAERGADLRPWVSRIVYSPDGTRVVIVGGTVIPTGKDSHTTVGAVRYWERRGNWVSGTSVEGNSGEFTAGLFSPDGKRFYLGSRGANQKTGRLGKGWSRWWASKAQCWDTTGASLKGTDFAHAWFEEIFWSADGERNDVTAMTLDPTGTRLLLADGAGVWVFDAATGQRRGGLMHTPRE